MASLIALVLGGVIPLGLWSIGGFSGGALSFFLVLIAAWSAARTAGLGEARHGITYRLFYAFVYVFLGVQPLLSVAEGGYPVGIDIEARWAWSAAIMTVVGIVGFEVGYARAERWRTAHVAVRGGAQRVRLDRAALLCFVGGVWLAILVREFGLDVFVGIRGAASDFVFGTPMWWLLSVFPIRVFSAALLLYLVADAAVERVRERSVERRWKRRGVIIGAIALNLVVSFPLNAPRFWVGAVLLSSVLVVRMWDNRYLARILGPAMALVLLAMGPLDTRRLMWTADGEVSSAMIGQVVRDSMQSFATDSNFDGFGMMALTAEHVAEHGFAWGKQLALPALFWVPREAWPEKPVGTSAMVAEARGLLWWNRGSPLWMEGYVNFGWVGTFGLLFAFGYLGLLADQELAAFYRGTGDRTRAVLSAFFAGNSLILLRGDIVTGTCFLQLFAVTGIVIAKVLSERAARDARGAPVLGGAAPVWVRR